jgi:hypothetical protein
MAGTLRAAMIGAVAILVSATALAAMRDAVTIPHPVELAHGKGGDSHPHISHPHMAEAAHLLAQANEELREADSDFGGHRSQAMALVNQALEEIRLGYGYGGASHSGPLPPQ